ncbi:MAG: flagellar export chaperone FliS [Proteobacteria bacterium]|nr:flagellar export chaperone FliS [Pseudomonadota bacterium]
MHHSAYQSYHSDNLAAQTAQASPVQLVLILTDGLLEELFRARAHIEAGRYEQKAHSLDRALGMLNGLASALDLESGSAVVASLGELYDYCARRLYQAGVALDVGIIDEVVGLLGTLRSGWEGMQARHG